MSLEENRYYRWAMIIARAEGAISGARQALERRTGMPLPEFVESETELSELRAELRDLAVRTAA